MRSQRPSAVIGREERRFPYPESTLPSLRLIQLYGYCVIARFTMVLLTTEELEPSVPLIVML